MNLDGHRAVRHARERNARRYDERDERDTAGTQMQWGARQCGIAAFDLDVAACEASHFAPRYFTKKQDGLKRSWRVRRWFCNPPYTDLAPWLAKAWAEAKVQAFELGAMLLPASRVEQPFWQEHVEPFRDRGVVRFGYTLETRYPPGRTHFRTSEGPLASAPFPVVWLIWRLTREWKP